MSERTWTLIVVLVVSIGIGAAFLREPLLAPYRHFKEQAEQDSTRVTDLNEALRQRSRSHEVEDRVRQLYGEPLDADGRRLRLSRFYAEVEKLVLAADLELSTIQPRPEHVDEDGIVQLPMVVTCQGDLQGLVKLLAAVRASPALIGVERLVVQRRERTDKPLMVQASLVSYGVLDAPSRERMAAERNKKGGRG